MKRMILYLLLGCAAFTSWAQIPTPLPYAPAAAAPGQPPAAVITAPAAIGGAPASGLLNGYVADDTYKLRAGDTVSFQILEDRVWNGTDAPKTLVVADSGELDVPYIGRVMAVDKTSKQLALDIKTALEKDYYNQATVILSLNVANRILGKVYIWGQVRQQGALDIQINEELTAGKAILRAGGFSDFADKSKVKVVRANAYGKGDKQTFELDMKEILENGKIEKDVALQPNDLIIVPGRLINF